MSNEILIEPWTKKGIVIVSQDDCVNEVREIYTEANPHVSWEGVINEDRYEAAMIANSAIKKMMRG